MHLSAPINRYMQTMASNGRILQDIKTGSQKLYTHTHSITIIGNIVHEPWSRYYRTNTYVFMKVTAYMARGVQTIC